MTVDAALFDLDDTLYPYAPCNEAGKRAAHDVATTRGYEMDFDAFEGFYQHGRVDVKRDLTGTAASHERLLYFKRALEHHTGRPQPADALALGDAYWEGYLEAMALFDGVRATLKTLRADGIKVAIVTNLTTHIQLRKLEHLDIADHIDCLLTSEEVGQEKPGSVPFTLALSRLECPPSRALMVGDSVSADVVGANALGIETVLFDHDGVSADTEGPYRTPDHRIDDFGAVTEVVR